METKGKFILLFASHYSMRDEMGYAREGITANYMLTDNLDPREDTQAGSKGMRPSKGAIPLDKLGKIKQVPAFYNGTFELKTGSDGKPVLSIVDLEFESLISAVPLADSEAAAGSGSAANGAPASDKKKGAS